MTEYIDREALRNALYEADAITMKGVEIINNFPAVDVVEVVRCKDCRMYVDNKEAFVKYCTRGLRNINVQPDAFCSYGERKE